MSALTKLYSKLAREIENSPLKKATPEQWTNYLRNRGVKQEELFNWEEGLRKSGVPQDYMMTPTDAAGYFRVFGDVPLRETSLKSWNSRTPEEKELIEIGLDEASRGIIDNRFATGAGGDVLGPKYGSEYSLKGAPEDAYEELVLHSPWAEPLAKDSPHFTDIPGGDKNIGWLRYNTRQLEDEAQKLFHLDEIQSARHQEGKTKGYADKREIEKLKRQYDDSERAYSDRIKELGGDPLIAEKDRVADEHYFRSRELRDAIESLQSNTPDAPFKKDWSNLLARRALLEAADKDADIFSWTSGNMQQRRWRDMAGEGTQRFYDKELPAIINKELKQHGVVPEDYFSVKDPSLGYDTKELPPPLAAIMARPSHEYDLGDYAEMMHDIQDQPATYMNAFMQMGMPRSIASDAIDEASDFMRGYAQLDTPDAEMEAMSNFMYGFGNHFLFNTENKLPADAIPAVRLRPEVRESILKKGFPKYMLPLGAAGALSTMAPDQAQAAPDLLSALAANSTLTEHTQSLTDQLRELLRNPTSNPDSIFRDSSPMIPVGRASSLLWDAANLAPDMALELMMNAPAPPTSEDQSYLRSKIGYTGQ